MDCLLRAFVVRCLEEGTISISSRNEVANNEQDDDERDRGREHITHHAFFRSRAGAGRRFDNLVVRHEKPVRVVSLRERVRAAIDPRYASGGPRAGLSRLAPDRAWRAASTTGSTDDRACATPRACR